MSDKTGELRSLLACEKVDWWAVGNLLRSMRGDERHNGEHMAFNEAWRRKETMLWVRAYDDQSIDLVMNGNLVEVQTSTGPLLFKNADINSAIHQTPTVSFTFYISP